MSRCCATHKKLIIYRASEQSELNSQRTHIHILIHQKFGRIIHAWGKNKGQSTISQSVSHLVGYAKDLHDDLSPTYKPKSCKLNVQSNSH